MEYICENWGHAGVMVGLWERKNMKKNDKNEKWWCCKVCATALQKCFSRSVFDADSESVSG